MYKDHSESKKQKHFKVVRAPCNIYKDERILSYDYNHGLKQFKIKTIFPQKASLKFYKKNEK